MPEHYSDEWRKNTDDTIREIRRDLYIGNGRPGLTYRVASVEADVQAIKDREERRSKKQDRIEVAVWVAVVMAIIQLVTSHLH